MIAGKSSRFLQFDNRQQRTAGCAFAALPRRTLSGYLQRHIHAIMYQAGGNCSSRGAVHGQNGIPDCEKHLLFMNRTGMRSV
jgi:hypothetical protein